MDHFKHVFATHHDASGAPLLTSSQMSLIVSILSAGTTIGSFSMSFVGELFGRRINLIIGCAVFALGVALQVAASAIPLFAVGRLFAGLGLGFISAVVPLYQSEAAPKWIRTFGSTSFIHCFTNELYRLLIVTTVQALQQLSGINFIFYYGTDFFQKSGLTNPIVIGLITNIVNVVMTPPGLDRFPVPVHFLLRLDLGSCRLGRHWRDLFPPNSIQKCRTLHYFELDLEFRYQIRDPLNMVDSGPGNANLGSKVFFIWGTFCLVAVFFVYFFVYETKGLSLEEVYELYEKVPKARKSASFVPIHQLAEDSKVMEGVVDAEKMKSIQIEQV
ncbi:hypothetical protein V1520DRAFT_315274 [Lipomyces starkeyi]|uniref:Major facilitator superfamily (MFS) profile domain-containing protein n=1 Tax=Lipomyces starkeyi NRRL Y-11557 TaxID=675824 RepID=A0A1E3Q154_LIPST|nr:hypothetical protein LIPSTDRAFT_4676 [Lipomyces starkeyi NRRL Y-11557]